MPDTPEYTFVGKNGACWMPDLNAMHNNRFCFAALRVVLFVVLFFLSFFV